MNALEEHTNDTISSSHINAMMPLVSLLSTHFLVNSFILITNMRMESIAAFVKIASEYYLEINYNRTIERDDTVDDENYINDYNKGYLVIGKSDLNFTKVLNGTPKLIVAIYTVEGNDSIVPKFLSEIVIPPPVAFFAVPIITSDLSSNKPTFKCLRLYKPISTLALKAFPTMFYGGLGKPKWTWESKNMNWLSFKKEVRNMSGVNISIGLVSHLDERFTVDRFWNGKNSFFWSSTEEILHHRSVLQFRQISFETEKTAANQYRAMLRTEVDGLGILPIITTERSKKLKFIPTGIDQKYYLFLLKLEKYQLILYNSGYHLMVRRPQYVYSWNSIFKPLANESWISLGIAILLISITLKIAKAKEKPPMADLSSCFLIIFGFVCSQGCSNMPTNLSGRAVCYIALLFSILIYQFYTSNFYSLLSTKEVSLPFSSIEEFVAKRTHKLFVHPDTGIYNYITTAQTGIFKKLGDMLRADTTHDLTNERIKQSLGRVCKGTAAILGLPSQTIPYRDLTCELVPVNSGYFPRNTVTVLRKGFPFMSQFKYAHLRLKETGITHKYMDQYFRVYFQRKTKEVENEAVTMIHVAFLFVLLVAVIVLSWIILGVEIITSKKKKKNKKGWKLLNPS